MSDANFNLGFVQIPLAWLWKWPLRAVRFITGTREIQKELRNMQHHVEALTEFVLIVAGFVSGGMSANDRERLLKAAANFTLLRQGMNQVQGLGNPITAEEFHRLREYVDRAERGHPFSGEEAEEFKRLANVVVRDYSGQDWVTELLKLALFIFAVYFLAEILKPQQA